GARQSRQAGIGSFLSRTKQICQIANELTKVIKEKSLGKTNRRIHTFSFNPVPLRMERLVPKLYIALDYRRLRILKQVFALDLKKIKPVVG
ncbi:MAG: hypothetical protein ACYTEX_22740, partial [Planctomycetota bacterium]